MTCRFYSRAALSLYGRPSLISQNTVFFYDYWNFFTTLIATVLSTLIVQRPKPLLEVEIDVTSAMSRVECISKVVQRPLLKHVFGCSWFAAMLIGQDRSPWWDRNVEAFTSTDRQVAGACISFRSADDYGQQSNNRNLPTVTKRICRYLAPPTKQPIEEQQSNTKQPVKVQHSMPIFKICQTLPVYERVEFFLQ